MSSRQDVSKSYKFSGIFLVYLMASTDCQSSSFEFKGKGSITYNATNLDLSLTFSDDQKFDSSRTTYHSCDLELSVWPTRITTLRCNEMDVSCPISCSEWSTWSSCSARCFTGQKIRKRFCDRGNGLRSEEIETQECCADGKCSAPESLSQWSNWTDCAMSNGRGIMYRYRNVTYADDGTTCCLPTNISLVDKQVCGLYTGNWSAWSKWSKCLSSGEQHRHRSFICSQNQPNCLLPSNGSSFETKNCTSNFVNWSDWSNWSECSSSGEQYRHRSLICSQNQPQCLLPSNDSSFERKNCTFNPDSSTQGNRKENIKEDEKRYTLSEIILVAFGCLLMGVILTALLFTLYLKRTQQGCFSNIIMEPQDDSRQQCDPDLQFQTKKAVAKKYDPKKPESADSKYENKSEETKYQSLNSNQIDNDQQTYDKLELKEPLSDHHGNEPRSGRLKQTGNDERTDHMTNKTEGVNDNARDSDLGGHNYFILENENISRESKTSNLGRPNSYAVVGDEVRDSNLGTQDEESNAAHEYFVLEPIENRHNQD